MDPKLHFINYLFDLLKFQGRLYKIFLAPEFRPDFLNTQNTFY
jgi:hypothetical protein